MDSLSETTKNQAFLVKRFAFIAYCQSFSSIFLLVTALLYTLNLTVKSPLLRGFEFTVQKTGQLNAKKSPFDTQRPTYGLSSDQIADVLERDSRTVGPWQKALGKKSQSFHLALCTLIGLTLTFIQMDENWSYLKKKKRQLWVFITVPENL